MTRRAEHVFTELGFFTDSQCTAVKERMQGGSFLHFDVSWSSFAGNCTLIVRAGIDAHADGSEVTEEELTMMFLHCAISEIWQLARETA